MPILTQAQAQTPKLPNQLDYATEPFAMVRDSPECHLRMRDGHASFGGDVTNPAQSCPDSFAWLLFAQAVSQHFWEDWSTDRQTWPSDPWPRCRPGEAPGQCCAGVEISNDAAPLHCPVYPGPTPGVPDDQVRQPVTAHQMSLTEATGRADTPWKDVPDSLKAPVIGALQDELIYRNEPMVNYVFDNELYFTEGLARVFRNAVAARAAYAPRWPAPPDPSAAHPAAPALIAIDFPIRAVMVKVNWLAADQAPRLGIDPNDTVHPFITMDLLPRATPTDPKPAKKRYLLLSFHISSKDVPNWTWATFEHVDNQGRCDFLGCNDSFGYLAAELPAQAGLAPPARNYIPPHHAEAVAQTDVEAFALAARYKEAGRMSQGLVDLLASFAIAGGGTSDPSRPSQGDTAWRSYRLKGTQSDFVSATGVETRLGNSVTEAGFVNTSSCMTCHARAAITAEGLPAYSIFDRTMSDAGLAQSVNGTPNPAWFSVNAFFGDQGQREAPRQVAVQTDFVWGFRFACPTHESQYGPVWCKNVTKGYSQAVPARPN
ncbi:hypothetical protein V5F59_01530 [Xanthobacter autotrophicus DSM 431]|uniref:hypothetical protein n=1 Tax=Xanthobacter nonsaccharivorans TaxID=3119912 RepID=UPI0037291BFC